MEHNLTFNDNHFSDFNIKRRKAESAFWFLNKIKKSTEKQLHELYDGMMDSDDSHLIPGNIENFLAVLNDSYTEKRFIYLKERCYDVVEIIHKMHIVNPNNDSDKIFNLILNRTIKLYDKRNDHVSNNIASIMAYYSIVDNLMMIVGLYKKNDIEKELVKEANARLNYSFLYYFRVFLRLKAIIQAPKVKAILLLIEFVMKVVTNNVVTQATPSNDIIAGISFADMPYTLFDGKKSPQKPTIIQPYYIHVKGVQIGGKITLSKAFCAYLAKHQNTIILGFKGTKETSIPNWVTNIQQIVFRADITYKMALGLLIKTIQSQKDLATPIHVYGHSLGGGLTQFAFVGANNPAVKGYAYNSAGLSCETLRMLPLATNKSNMKHLYQRMDTVFCIGNQWGYVYTSPNIVNPFNAHCLDTLRNTFNQHIYFSF